MDQSATYSVVLSGDLKSGFEMDGVVDAFAKLFKLSPEKADAIVGKRFVVKKEVELKVAKSYQERLAAIGLEVRLKRHGGAPELALEPVEEPPAPGEDPSNRLGAEEMICPKCQLRQAKAEECSGCGVYVDKVPRPDPADEAAAEPAQQGPAASESVAEVADSDVPMSIKWLIAPVVVAILGALVWYLVAANLGYEFGAIAWLIGGAIGFAAVSSGARGPTIGAICGVLVLVSICGGKYMTVSNEQDQLAELLSSSFEFEGLDLREVYAQEVSEAQEFMALGEGENNLRHFMATYEYSEYTDPAQVTDAEIAIFHEYSQPRLEEIAIDRPTFEEWQQGSLTAAIEDLPTFDLMVESLDWKDMLFLLFGIGTAFQLANRGRTSGA